MASAALQVPPTYMLESYVINRGKRHTATAQIKLLPAGQNPAGFSALATARSTRRFWRLSRSSATITSWTIFQIQAVTEGREAMGSALVRLRGGGKLYYSGRCISNGHHRRRASTPTSTLNKIVYEEGARQ